MAERVAQPPYTEWYDTADVVLQAKIAGEEYPRYKLTADGTVATGDGTAEPTASGGSGAVVRAFPFAFDTADLMTGHSVYTPAVGDVLLDAWVSIATPWDGTTPKFDVGQFLAASAYGWWGQQWGDGLDMTATADGNHYAYLPALSQASIFSIVTDSSQLGVSGAAIAGNFPAGGVSGLRAAPINLKSASPIKIVVSTTGGTSGADPGATQGAATLYLVTATPVTA